MPLDEEKQTALVDTGWLSENVGNPSVRIVEVDVSPKSYKSEHIPGAVLWNIYSDFRDSDYRLRDKAATERTVRSSGISKDDTIVFYGYGACLGFWLMKRYGHARVRILDASKATWMREGRALTTDVPTPHATTYSLPDADETLGADQSLVERAIGRPGATILDTRSLEEYGGERFWPSGGQEAGGRAGHIPSAVHLPADGIFDERGAFRSRELLAAQTWFVLRHILGHDKARVYEGSRAEWGKMPSAPVDSSA